MMSLDGDGAEGRGAGNSRTRAHVLEGVLVEGRVNSGLPLLLLLGLLIFALQLLRGQVVQSSKAKA